MTTPIESIINIDALSEDDAFRVFSSLRDKFGWAGTVFCRDDVESLLEQYDPINEELVNNGLTDEQWADFSGSKNWTRYCPEWMCEKGLEIINDLLHDWLKEQELLK